MTVAQATGKTLVADAGSRIVFDLAEGDDLAAAVSDPNMPAVYDLAFRAGASATLRVAQHEGASAVTGSGDETVILSDSGAVTAAAEIEAYQLSADGNTITVNSDKLDVNITGGAGADTVIIGAGLVVTGTYALGAGTNVLQLGDGASISGAEISATGGSYAIEIEAGASVTMTSAQHALIITAPGTETVTLSDAPPTLLTANAAVEVYLLANGDQTFVLATGNQSVSTGTSAVTISTGDVTSFTTGAVNGTGSTTTLLVAASADISGLSLTSVETITLADDVDATMTIVQHVLIGTALGSNQVTLTDTGAVTGAAGVESYVLFDGANTFTLGALAQNVTGGTGANTLVFGAGVYTGTFAGFGADDTYRVVDGTDLSGTTVLETGILDFQNLPVTVMLNAAQNGSLTITNASGAQIIVVTEADTFTADAAIETYRLTGASEITVVAGTNVAVVDGDVANQTVIVNGLTTTGSYNFGGGTGDTVSITATSNISGSEFTGVERVILGENVNATMTIAQNALITTAAGTNIVTLSEAGDATGAALVESYVLANGDQTFTLGAAGQSVTTGTGTGNVTVAFNGRTATGTINGTTANLTLDVAGATDLTNANLVGVNAIIVAENATLRLTAEQADALNVTGAGNVIITALGGSDVDISGIIVTGDILLDTDNPDPVLSADFTFGTREYTVSGARTLDVTLVDDLPAGTTFAVEKDATLRLGNAQVGTRAVTGDGSVVIALPGAVASTGIDPVAVNLAITYSQITATGGIRVAPTTLDSLFNGQQTYNDDVSWLDTSNATSAAATFRNASAFNQDIGAWNVSNVTNMSEMFQGAGAFNQDIGAWDVGNVTNTTRMFRDAWDFNKDIGAWDVGSVIVAHGMFRFASAFNKDIGDWDVGNVADMGFMFGNASAFNQDIGDWDVGSVTSMTRMFLRAGAFNQDIGDWNVGNVIDMVDIFRGSGMSVNNLDSTLVGWSDINTHAGETGLQTEVTLGLGTGEDAVSYSNATAVQELKDSWNWTIQGGIQATEKTIDGETYDVVVDDNSLQYIGTGNATRGQIIHALGGNNIIDGSIYDDIIYAGRGNDEMFGDSGSDRYVFMYSTEGDNFIWDFGMGEVGTVANADILDISVLLDVDVSTATTAAAKAALLHDEFIFFTAGSGGALRINIDADGHGPNTDIVSITVGETPFNTISLHETYLATLIDQGNLFVG